MEQLIILFFFVLAFCAHKIYDLQKRLKNEQFESARLFEANDKLKATLVKKDLEIANLEANIISNKRKQLANKIELMQETQELVPKHNYTHFLAKIEEAKSILELLKS